MTELIAAVCRCGHPASMHPADLTGAHPCGDTIALTNIDAPEEATAPCGCRAYIARSAQ